MTRTNQNPNPSSSSTAAFPPLNPSPVRITTPPPPPRTEHNAPPPIFHYQPPGFPPPTPQPNYQPPPPLHQSTYKPPQLPFQNISNFVSVKLDGSNFLVWKDQIPSILISTNLFGYVDGSIQPEPPWMYQNNTAVVNPAYLEWRSLDHFVGSCINATVTPSLAPELLRLATARDKWNHLSKIFTEHFFARKSMLRSQLHSIRKGHSSIFEFLQQIKSISDSLAEIGEPVPDSDLVMYTLAGLGSEYSQFVVAMQNKDRHVSFSELRSRATTHEQWMKDQAEENNSSLVMDPTNATFYVKKYSSNTNYSKKPSSYNTSASTGVPSGHSFRKGEFNPAHKQVLPHRQVINWNEIPCQICNKIGHFAARCRFRYAPSKNQYNPEQKAFVGLETTSTNLNPWSSDGQPETETCYGGQWGPGSSGPIWIPDSGATSHLTNDPSLLTTAENYHGFEQVMVGNGKVVMTKAEEDAKAEVQIWKYVFGFVEMAVVKCAVDLGIADTIDAKGQPMTLSELSDELCCSSPSLQRIMRFLVHQKIFKESCTSDGTRSYDLTSLSRLLMKGGERSLRDLLLLEISPPMLAPWQYLSGAVRENGPPPFVAAHGEDLWAYSSKHPEHSEVINNAMACDARVSIPAVVDGCAEYFHGVSSVVDVGGGNGATLCALIKAFPITKGINFDLPHVVSVAPEINGVEHIGGDMFESIPKADVAIIKWVLHDWGDDECIRILRNCREAVLDGENGKVIIIEAVINEEKDYKLKYVELMLDMVLMAHTSYGKERTKEEWGSILSKAGFSRFTVKTIEAVQSVIIAYP